MGHSRLVEEDFDAGFRGGVEQGLLHNPFVGAGGIDDAYPH